VVTAALKKYISLYNTQFPFLDNGFNLPDPVPEDILLPWANFMAKYGLDAAAFSVYGINQGVGNEMALPALYAMKVSCQFFQCHTTAAFSLMRSTVLLFAHRRRAFGHRTRVHHYR
jgi:hypothetical protein